MSQDDSARTKLTKLADTLLEDILATPDAEIVAEVGLEGIERGGAVLGRAKMAKAKSDFKSWKDGQAGGVAQFDRAAARIRFEQIRAGNADLDRKMTLAARNGEAPTDADLDGLGDDLSDLQRLDGEDEQK